MKDVYCIIAKADSFKLNKIKSLGGSQYIYSNIDKVPYL